jgi:hypothetical protein
VAKDRAVMTIVAEQIPAKKQYSRWSIEGFKESQIDCQKSV